MEKEYTINEFFLAVLKLPFDEKQGQWARWLGEYHTPGFYNRQVDKRRNARYAYNHLANPEMLLWLIQVSGVSKKLIELASSESDQIVNKNRRSAAIRKHVPWNVLEGALRKLPEETATHWLQYWKPFQIEPAISEPWVLNHSAGNQLSKVKPGDVVWIISVDEPGILITLGPIHVEKVLGQQKAEALLGSKLWPADWHIVDTSENARRAKYADLSPFASLLRFDSKDFPRILPKKGKISGTQFQKMRKLERESAELISFVWHATPSDSEIAAGALENELNNLSSLDEERIVRVRREQSILRKILFQSSSVGHCGICGCEYPVSLLVAAHIKPRAECSDSERRDTYNLMPLCSLGCDALFEQGFISVEKGRVITGPNKVGTKDLKVSIKSVVGSLCPYWSVESKKYFEWRANQYASID